jgi:hypothetical protein
MGYGTAGLDLPSHIGVWGTALGLGLGYFEHVFCTYRLQVIASSS